MAKYPPILAGRKITAGLLGGMLGEVVLKQVTTERPNVTDLNPDPDLTVALEGGAVYLAEFILYFAALNTVDVVTEWAVPDGAAGLKSVLGPASGAGTQTDADGVSLRAGVHQFGTNITYAGVRNNPDLAFRVQEEGAITTSSAGTLAIAWGQGASNASPAKLFGASYMRVTRIG